jgi:hypothetical protein
VVAPALKAVPSSGLWDGPVTPVQVQGPKSKDVMRDLFDDPIPDIPYYRCEQTDLDSISIVISRFGVDTARTSLDGPPPALLGSQKDHLSLHGSWGGPCAEG